MKTNQWTEYAVDGHVVTDIGQIAHSEICELDAMVSAGFLLTGMSYAFPVPKRYWVRSDHTGNVPGPLAEQRV